ncbi:MAG: hypothetical protein KKB74_02565 [Bacteroidetes bacterium]|nr:hypothetical protein [Bacteroidota bacterium]
MFSLKEKLFKDLKHSALVNVSGSDFIVEINTKGYGDNPIVIQGVTEGAAVTARGVYVDMLRVVSRI